MSSKSKTPTKPGRKDLAQALENFCMSMALWHAGRGSVAETYLDTEMRKMAEMVFKNLTPDGMMKLQAMLEALLKQEAEKMN